MPRYSKASAVFRRPGCSSGSKTDRSGYWHVNQCADLAGSPAKPPALSSASGCRWFESLGCALHGNDGNHFKFTVASFGPGSRAGIAGLPYQKLFFTFFPVNGNLAFEVNALVLECFFFSPFCVDITV